MNNSQFRRYQKIFIEEFYLLDWKNNLNNFTFAVSGSSYNIYYLEICKDNKKIKCSCLDFKDNCNNNLICKHSCFILFLIIKLFYKFNPHYGKIKLNRPTGYNILNTSEYFNNYLFSNLEILLIEKKIKTINTKNNSFIKKELIDKYNYHTLIIKQKQLLYQQFIENQLIKDQECGICFQNITENTNYLSCPDCKKFIHKTCMLKWLSKNQNCIYCRSNIWENFYSIEINQQFNLMDINI